MELEKKKWNGEWTKVAMVRMEIKEREKRKRARKRDKLLWPHTTQLSSAQLSSAGSRFESAVRPDQGKESNTQLTVHAQLTVTSH